MIKNQNTSGVSLAIRKTMFSLKNSTPLIEKENSEELTIKIANTLEEREATFRLAYQVYLDKGYLNQNGNEWLVQNYDAHRDTVVLIVKDKQKNIAGSLTIVFSASSKLPAEKIYREEIKYLTDSGKKIAEISRFVISPDYRNSKEILVLLFNYLFIYIQSVKKYDGLAIQVNPRHMNYYKALLSFDEIGGEKPCPQVQNAPAVLLYLSIIKYQAELKRCGNPQNTDKKERTLFQYFIKPEQESLVSHYLEKQARPMSAEEKLYFGFSESGISRAVCV